MAAELDAPGGQGRDGQGQDGQGQDGHGRTGHAAESVLNDAQIIDGFRPPAAYGLINAAILRCFPALVRELDGDPLAILSAHGIDPTRCEQGRAVTCAQWIGAMEQAARDLHAPAFGLMLAERQGGGGIHGPLNAAMRNAETFGDALRYAAAHSGAHSLAVRVWMGQTVSGASTFVGHDILVGSVPDRRQAMEQVLLSGHLGARVLTGDRAAARRVHFRHRAVSPLAVYRRKFGCEVRFCQNEDGIAFEAAALASPIVDADSAAFREAAELIEHHYNNRQQPLQMQVRGVVMQRLSQRDCSGEEICRLLNVHPRTLLRKLREEGTSFQHIKDEVRRDLMLYYLRETDLEVSRISEKLGFSEQSVLSRFSRKWLGASPSDLRARHLASAG